MHQFIDAFGRQFVPMPIADVETRVVHQNIEAAECRLDVFADLLHGLGVHQVGRLHMRLAALLLDALSEAFQLLTRAAGQHGGGAFLGQRERGGLADATAGASDPGDLARELRHRRSLLVANLRGRH